MVRYALVLFEVHQPYRLRTELIRDVSSIPLKYVVGSDLRSLLFNSELNESIIKKVSSRCYIPTTKLLIETLKEARGGVKINLSLSGTVLEQLLEHVPESVELFKELVRLELAEVVAEPYYHSLVSLYEDPAEFLYQVSQQVSTLRRLFDARVTAFVNTEMVYNDAIAGLVSDMGFNAVFTEGVERVLRGRSPNYVYRAPCGIRVFTRNYRLSDDVAFRFSDRTWDQYPLYADRYSDWILRSPGDLVLIAMDYETFGEHHGAETGILEFLRHLIKFLVNSGIETLTVSDAVSLFKPVDTYSVPVEDTISWADVEKDLSAWLGSLEQRAVFNRHKSLYGLLRKLDDEELLHVWRCISTSDHFYYMSPKGGASGEVHRYFSPYGSSVNAYCLLNCALTLIELKALASGTLPNR